MGRWVGRYVGGQVSVQIRDVRRWVRSRVDPNSLRLHCADQARSNRCSTQPNPIFSTTQINQSFDKI